MKVKIYTDVKIYLPPPDFFFCIFFILEMIQIIKHILISHKDNHTTQIQNEVLLFNYYEKKAIKNLTFICDI